ncbi:BnaA02g35840D [Brassica napus]|uniref:BnaA02g35840D protein n=1 Tax=Brassica napus TaxID=3708 RepID=A0A078JVX0_BRANA|nr:BnaA02g35840D [Brassica napus]
MSEGSRRSRVTITLGRSGQVVSRDGSDLEDELPRVGTKRSVKERLGNLLDSDAVTKRQRGEASFSGNDLQISKNDLRFKLLQRNAKRRTQSDGGSSTMDLRQKLLSKSEQPPPPRSLDSRPRMAEPRDGPLPPPSGTVRGPSSHMLSSGSNYSPRTRDDIPRRSPERLLGSSRGRSPPRNAGSISGTPRALSPPRNTRSFSGASPPRNAGRMIARPRDLSPPRDAGRMIARPRDLSPPRHAGRISGHPRDLSPPGHAGRISGHPRDLSPARITNSFSSGYRTMSPTRNVGSSYMSSSRGFSPPRNPGSYMGSSMGSPPSRNVDDFNGRSRMLDDVRASPYGFRGVLNSQAPTSGPTFARPMLPPPVPNPHLLPPLSQLPPFGSIMQNSPFPVEEPLTVDSFLDSLGLGRYSLAFKREEVDMNTIKQMKESDLKDLIIPMGPRKRILQAIACLPR